MTMNSLTALHDMALFVEVGRTLSFRKASQNLGLPAATLSRRISALETTLGVPLFHRSTRVVTLTKIGAQHFDRCEQLVDEAQFVMREFSETATAPTGHLKISMPVDLGVRFVGPLIPEFRKLYPNITFDLDLSASNTNVVADGIDIAIRLEHPSKARGKAPTIGTVAMGLFASPAYLYAHSKPVKPAELVDHNCLLAHGRKLTENWKLNHVKSGIEKNIAVSSNCRCNNLGLTSYFAEQGLGIAKLATSIAGDAVKAGRLEPLLPLWEFTPLDVKFITRTSVDSVSVRVFQEFISNKWSRFL